MENLEGRSSEIRVFGIGTSRTLRVHWVLSELGLAYETREIVPRTVSMEDPDFVRVSARGKVPILEEGPLVIGESGAICFHLADRYRDRVILSPDSLSPSRALYYDLSFYILMELDAPLYVIRRHEGLSTIYGEAPVATQAAREYFNRQVAECERRLELGGPHLLGGTFSVADILLSSCLAWAGLVGIGLAPILIDYQARLSERPAYHLAVERNFPPGAVPVPTASLS